MKAEWRDNACDWLFLAVVLVIASACALGTLLAETWRLVRGPFRLHHGRHCGGRYRYDFPAREVAEPTARRQPQAVEPPVVPGSATGEATARLSHAAPVAGRHAAGQPRVRASYRPEDDTIALSGVGVDFSVHPRPHRARGSQPWNTSEFEAVPGTAPQPVYGTVPVERVLESERAS